MSALADLDKGFGDVFGIRRGAGRPRDDARLRRLELGAVTFVLLKPGADGNPNPVSGDACVKAVALRNGREVVCLAGDYGWWRRAVARADSELAFHRLRFAGVELVRLRAWLESFAHLQGRP